MQNQNHVWLIGNLTRDIDNDERSFGYTSGGTARANVSIAVNRSVKKGDEWIEEVSYFDVTIWGKTAENLKPYLKKGKKIAVDGYLKQDRWEKDGQKMSRITVVANTVELLSRDNNGNNNQADVLNSSNNTVASHKFKIVENAPEQNFENGISEDIPY